jgi:two-component system, chemotaxis family, sensor kinase CheA
MMSGRRPPRSAPGAKRRPAEKPVAASAVAEERVAARPGGAPIEIDDELATLFIGEALDHLGSIETCVLTLEKQPRDPQALDDVFRPFHTVKASAGALGLTDVEEVAHAIEDLLDRARSGEHLIGTPEIEATLLAVDLLTAMIRDFEARRSGGGGADFSAQCASLCRTIAAFAAPAKAAPAPQLRQPEVALLHDAAAAHDSGSRTTIKVETSKLDNLIDLMGELVILQSMIRESSGAAGHGDERLGRSLAQLHRISGDLHRAAIALRLVPIRQTFERMRRLVRDVSRKSGKAVELDFVGEETELDRKVIEEIADPLMHMVRNSIDHGIEDQKTRLAAGKPAAGRIVLRAFHEGGSIVISVADDGRGIDTGRLLERAVERGVVARGATLTESEICALIFTPGLSTADAVTEISGRGVGMDVVRRNLEALRGRIDVRSQAGAGTTITFKLPLTLATIEGLVVGVGEERFIVPTFSVCELLRCSDELMHSVPGQGQLVEVRNSLVPVVRLADLFGMESTGDSAVAALVVIEDHGERVALQVDRLLGKQEVVIKPLGDAFDRLTGVAGGAILADGRVGLIVDSAGLIQLRTRVPPRAA